MFGPLSELFPIRRVQSSRKFFHCLNILYLKSVQFHNSNMYYEESSRSNLISNENAVVVDLRSDTLTKPTKRMREAMFNAEVGDDVFEEDPTLKKLEEKAAEMVGMEAAIFVSSGTMGNLIAIMNHCEVRGCEAYCGDAAHCLLHEQCGASQIAGVSLRPLRNNSDGTFDLGELKSKLRKDRHHEPISQLVLVENTLNGKIVPQRWIEELVTFCNEHNLKLHMDGARLWNASVGSEISAKEIVSGFDSVTFCLSKGLGAPVGSLLCGNKKFVTKARRTRKVLGGGMRQAGILGAAGLVALQDTIPILKDDHRRAFLLASSINKIHSTIFTVDLSTVQTNMVFVNVDSNVVSGGKFASRLREIRDDDKEDKIIVKCLPLSESFVRFVFSYEITDTQLTLAIRKISYIIKKLDPNV
ncbi:L-allo-threonine aldolase isoform X2 [Colletes gigas]|uniref:L-allo-threonine aldolase isoform X2 n=2 Tax=Colletes gigas TaxID=935657 RepID=UPI001C9AAA75|nr:L-allo-threonine aldolase isoform X2 [Colletes gigas]